MLAEIGRFAQCSTLIASLEFRAPFLTTVRFGRGKWNRSDRRRGRYTPKYFPMTAEWKIEREGVDKLMSTPEGQRTLMRRLLKERRSLYPGYRGEPTETRLNYPL